MEAIRKLYVDDRHAISPQRARNIINWINRKEDLTTRWLRLLIPNLTSEFLEAIAAEAPNTALRPLAQRELVHRKDAPTE